jgi:hypothetical protein
MSKWFFFAAGMAVLSMASCGGTRPGRGPAAADADRGGPGGAGGDVPPVVAPPGTGGQTGPVRPPGPANEGPLPDLASVPGETRLRRLTLFEYNNTVRDLLGDVSAPAQPEAGFNDDYATGTSFPRGAPLGRAAGLLPFMNAAEDLAAAAAQRLPSLLPCTPLPTEMAEQEACVARFILQFGRRAYRRPLSDVEAAALRALFAAQRGPGVGATFEEAVADVVTAMLQSPQFLYHWELGPSAPVRDGSLIRFNGHEIASRLSYLLWGSMPDDALLDAADAGALSTADQIAQQARGLLDDPRARAGVGEFYVQWQEVAQLPESLPVPTLAFGPAQAQSMLNEARVLANSFVFEPRAPGGLQGLLTSPTSFIDAALAKLYGVELPATTSVPGGLQAVILPADQRAGLFTRAAFLTSTSNGDETNPIHRGSSLLTQVLCVDGLEEPLNVEIPPVPPALPGQTTRERFQLHGALPCAVACHGQIVDPAGYAFEHYDAIGAYRATEAGKPVDTRATFTLPSGEQFAFVDAIDLMGQLARSDRAQRCIADQWLRYLLRRRLIATEAPSLAALQAVFRANDFDLRGLIVDLTRTRLFSHRAPSAGEVLP